MGLGFLGRGRMNKALPIGLVHVFGAALGGAVTGGLIGWLGAALSLPSWRSLVVGLALLYALALSGRRRPLQFSWQRQAPRWGRTLPPYPRFLLWGLMLGSGLTTPLVSASLLVLLSVQLTTGVLFGAALGAVFGGTRQAMALLPLLRQAEPATAMRLLPRFATTARRGNLMVILAGALALVLAGWR